MDKKKSSPSRKASKRFKDWISIVSVKFIVLPLGWLPVPLIRCLGGVLGAIAWLFWRGYRRLAHLNIRLALGKVLSLSQQRRIVFQSAQNMVREFLQLCGWLRLSPARRRQMSKISGIEHLQSACQRQKGVILVTAHLSNFPLLSAGLCSHGYPNSFVIQQIKVESINTYYEELCTRIGIGTIYALPRHRCTLECLRHLRENKIVLMNLDLNAAGRSGLFVNFFGLPASTYTGPLVLARRTGASVLPAFVIRQPNGHYRIFLHPPLFPPGSLPGGEESYKAVLKKFNHLLEDYVQKYPEQWSWIYKRWKSRPPGGAKIYKKGY